MACRHGKAHRRAAAGRRHGKSPARQSRFDDGAMIPDQPCPDRDPLGAPTGPPPCFYWRCCRKPAELEKAGKAVCRACARRLRGREYPLRPPSRDPLYPALRDAADALDMLESRRRKRYPID